jgi:hypothetical protein
MLRRLLLLLLAAWATLASLPPAAAEPVFPPGLRIGLEPPGDARLSRHFPGFEDPDRKVAISILDLPAGAYRDIEASFFAKNHPGLEGLKRESFPFANGIGFLVSGHGQQNGVTVYKWFLLAKTVAGRVQNLATLIQIEVPKAARSIYTDAAIRKALASVTFRPAPIQEQLGLLPFKLTELAGFRVMRVLQAGGAILTDGPTDDLTRQAYMIVSVGRGVPAEPGDRGRFARDLLTSAPVRDLAVQSAEAMRIIGGPGYEVRATAKGLNGDAISLVQWLRFGAGGYLRVIGVSRKNAWDVMFRRFRAVRDGVDLR